MVSPKSTYRPIDAAILWCGLAAHQEEILQVALSPTGNLLKQFSQWPFLNVYVERIYDAIACGDLPATYLGHPVTPSDRFERAHLAIRYCDLRVWIGQYYPDDKPAFLFAKNIDHCQCVSLGAYLALKADLDAAERALEKMRQTYRALMQEMTDQARRQELSGQGGAFEAPSDVSTSVYFMIIGALLAIMLGKSKSGLLQSIYRTQTAIVDAITTQFPGVPGLSKRTLDRKFAEARRHFAQAEQA
jgi:hypothetical protein